MGARKSGGKVQHDSASGGLKGKMYDVVRDRGFGRDDELYGDAEDFLRHNDGRRGDDRFLDLAGIVLPFSEDEVYMEVWEEAEDAIKGVMGYVRDGGYRFIKMDDELRLRGAPNGSVPLLNLDGLAIMAKGEQMKTRKYVGVLVRTPKYAPRTLLTRAEAEDRFREVAAEGAAAAAAAIAARIWESNVTAPLALAPATNKMPVTNAKKDSAPSSSASAPAPAAPAAIHNSAASSTHVDTAKSQNVVETVTPKDPWKERIPRKTKVIVDETMAGSSSAGTGEKPKSGSAEEDNKRKHEDTAQHDQKRVVVERQAGYWRMPKYPMVAPAGYQMDPNGVGFRLHIVEGIPDEDMRRLDNGGMRYGYNLDVANIIILKLEPGNTAREYNHRVIALLVAQRGWGVLVSYRWIKACDDYGQVLPIQGYRITAAPLDPRKRDVLTVDPFPAIM